MAIEVNETARLSDPYAKVGLILVTWADGSAGVGTAAVVGRNDILTAGHNVYNPDKGGWASSYEFYFGADYNSFSDQFDSYSFSYSLTSDYEWETIAWPDLVYVDSNNSTLLLSESQYDIAVIGVSKPLGDFTGWFGLDPNRNFGQIVTEVGYPQGSNGMMAGSVYVTKNSYYSVYMSNTASMGPGSSGGPLFTDDGYIIGVKTSGSESGAIWADIGLLFDQIVSAISENDHLLGDSIDTTPPNVTSFDPSDGSTQSKLDGSITIQFDEAVRRGEGTISIRIGSANGKLVESFDVATSSRLSLQDSTLVINPSSPFKPDTQYFVVLPAGVITDFSGNPYSGISTYDFRTITDRNYSTLDYLTDLTALEMANARVLTFKAYPSNTVGWDMFATVSGTNAYALTHSIYKFSAIKGAIYDVISTSYFDPYLLRLYDDEGNTLVANDEQDDFRDGQDWLWDWEAPYTGDYYVNASWNQGVYETGYSLSIYANLDSSIVPDTTVKFVWGTVNDDLITSSSNNEQIDGRDGIDTVIYSGSLQNYFIDFIAGTVNDSQAYRDGFDTLINIERLQFADTNLALDTNGIAGQAYRIYQAAFDRAPDATGLGYWISVMDNGALLTGVAGGFIGSAEFQSRYGNTSDVGFIKLLYENVLDRQPDAGGYAFWQMAMGRGLTREGLLVEFSESVENKANVEGLIANGIEYTPFIS